MTLRLPSLPGSLMQCLLRIFCPKQRGVKYANGAPEIIGDCPPPVKKKIAPLSSAFHLTQCSKYCRVMEVKYLKDAHMGSSMIKDSQRKQLRKVAFVRK